MSTKKPSRGVRLQTAAQNVLDAIESAKDQYQDALDAWQAAMDVVQGHLNDVEGALEELKDIRSEYEDWQSNLPDNLQQSAVAEKLQTLIDIDLDHSVPSTPEPDSELDLDNISEAAQEILDADLPLGFGRD